MAEAKKAPSDGKYILDGRHFRIAAGDPLPEGAEFVKTDNPAVKAVTGQKAIKGAPLNKAIPNAPETK